MKVIFEGQVIDINKYESAHMSVITHDFVLMVRRVEMELHKHRQDNNYWKPVKFSCPVSAPLPLQNSLNDLALGDEIMVTAEKKDKVWKVTCITNAKYHATNFEDLITLNDEIL